MYYRDGTLSEGTPKPGGNPIVKAATHYAVLVKFRLYSSRDMYFPSAVGKLSQVKVASLVYDVTSFDCFVCGKNGVGFAIFGNIRKVTYLGSYSCFITQHLISLDFNFLFNGSHNS